MYKILKSTKPCVSSYADLSERAVSITKNGSCSGKFYLGNEGLRYIKVVF